MPAERIVTVRMPSSLLAALKERTAEDYYADLSEQIRSIVRKGCLRYLQTTANSEDQNATAQMASAQTETDEERARRLINELKSLLQGGGAS